MAIHGTMVWEARTTATVGNVNGGGFKPGASGTDYSQQDTAQYDLTGVTTAAADAILLTASAASDMVGNIARINSGTNFTVGWYEIISVVAGVSITLDRTCTTAAGSGGAVKIGGALNLGTADDLLFETMEPGNIVHVKSGTYTMSAVSLAKDGTATSPIAIKGYNVTRGDNPAFANQPVLAFAGNASTFGNFWHLYNVSVTTTSANGLSFGSNGLAYNCGSNNSSGTAGRIALGHNANSMAAACDLQSANGTALNTTQTRTRSFGNYIHDSNKGATVTGSVEGNVVAFCIIESCGTAIELGSGADACTIINNTMYGASSPTGTGINLLATTSFSLMIMNNTISGFATGISAAALTDSNFCDWNNFYNNTTNRTNVTAGPNDTALDPGFVDAPNGNFAIGADLKAKGYPGAFPSALSTGYLDLGAVQRQEPAGGSGGGIRLAGHGGLAA